MALGRTRNPPSPTMFSRNPYNSRRIQEEERSLLRRRKLTYKRRTMLGIFVLGLGYLMLSAEPVMPRTLAQDVEDINPRVVVPSSGTWRSLTSTGRLGSPPGPLENDSYLDESATLFAPVTRVNCTAAAIHDFPPDLFTQSQRRHGALVFHFLVSIYIFYAIALVCDDYFVPAIESICEALHLPSDVAGATFMAVATSAPELFTNIIGTFITHGDLGVGTVVGSAVFNILAISAFCGLAAQETLQLDWWSLTRDCSFYSLAVIGLLIVLGNRKVFWYEALVLVILYGFYILVMYYNTACKRWAENLVFGKRPHHKGQGSHGGGRSRSGTGISQPSSSSKTYFTDAASPPGDAEKAPLIAPENLSKSSYGNTPPGLSSIESTSPDDEDEFEVSEEERDEMLIAKALHQTEVYAEEEKDAWGLFRLPFGQGGLKWVEWLVGWPARFFLVFTVPDCREHRFRKWYPLTFLMCIVWIALLTYVMSWMMTVIGYTLAVPDSVMGLTFIAAGTSVPEAVSSIIVTRQGLGSMGISNSIGSNTFDILMCLGVPWLIRASLISPDPIKIISGGLEYSTILLIASVILLYFLLACNKFVLNKRIGIIALLMYAAFLVISSLFELNVFFQVNLPTCKD